MGIWGKIFDWTVYIIEIKEADKSP